MDGDGADILDLTLLERSVREMVPGGPVLPRKETAEVVDQLRDAADTSIDLVLDVMRLERREADAVRARAAAGSVLIVDRLGWAKATGQSLTAMVGTAMPDDVRAAMETGRIPNTLEMAAVLSVLSTRVLGQFDPFGGGPHPDGAGRLLLVAPTIAQTEATLSVAPRDFRLWVALHESTHRVQFAAAPWLR
ncbi:MAG TPA: zinc-dependent metalloprotease, partial [Brevibacterium sp.]|nr:zinc-dependent metalloprotease [Brevibacterium sp.]